MAIIKIKPRIFISYAREDDFIAEFIYEHLRDDGYEPFMDKEKILAGDLFAKTILSELKRCDSIITVISPDSVKSEWCEFEVYYAHILNKVNIPIRFKNAAYETDSPLNFLQKEINYITLNDISSISKAYDAIKKRLSFARRKAKLRFFRMLLLSIGSILLIALFFTYGIKRINNYNYNQDKQQLVNLIKNSRSILKEGEIETYTNKFKGDVELISQLHFLEKNT